MPLFRTTADQDTSTNRSASATRNSNIASLFGDGASTVNSDTQPSSVGGRTLGGATRRGITDPRAARLQALEKTTQVVEEA